MKKFFIFLFIFLILFPIVSASDDDDECGWNNIGSCLAQKFFGFMAKILSAPITPLMNWTYKLMTQPVNISIFSGVWAIIVYILSLFYGILLLFSGFKFILAGESAEKRENAKSFLTNTIIMMVLVQSSYFIYYLFVEVGASLTQVIFNMIPSSFFSITINNVGDLGLQLIMVIPYALLILVVLIFLTLRYLFVAVGVVFFALGIFFYFINPLKQYGKLILNWLLVSILLPFAYSIVFLASSKLIDVGVFSELKILVMMGAFAMVITLSLIMLLFVVTKAANSKPVKQVVSVAKMVA